MTDYVKKQVTEYGDYQTPADFAHNVCAFIKETLHIEPTIVIEPTFGVGNFIIASIREFKKIRKLFGIEINTAHYNSVLHRIKRTENQIGFFLFNEDFFSFDFTFIKKEIANDDTILIIGNPPWVTNADLATVNSDNFPVKHNFKGFCGLDAITGKSNFDITESIIVKLLNEFKDNSSTIVMLCKTTVGRNIVKELKKYHFSLSEISMLTFDAMEIFDVSCEACVLVMKVGSPAKLVCDVYDFNEPQKRVKSFGWTNSYFSSDIGSYNNYIDGKCPFIWRQGVKHDCSKIMELSGENEDSIYTNGFKMDVKLEDTYIFPLIKSSDIKRYNITQKNARKNVIVTQKKVGDNTSSIAVKSPLLWDYLQHHAHFLHNRKSSIYKNAPPFSMFGVGDYSFKPYKIAISGFYKEPLFALTYNDVDLQKAIMFDDTCYFLGFDDYKQALITMLLLNSNLVQTFLKSVAFLDSKRPYTKEILMRIDLCKVTHLLNFKELLNIADTLNIKTELQEEDYRNFTHLVASL